MKKPCSPMLVAALAIATPAFAANYPVTAQQSATAEQVATAGVPLTALADNAPDSYTVKRGDTLWAISSLFLKSPWRWPELWGMNKQQIRNPHLIYPGQVLYLERNGDRARLRLGEPVAGSGGGDSGTLKLSPRVRTEDLTAAIPAIPASLIEPFLSKPLVIDEDGLATAPRVVAVQEGRVFTGVRDTVYVRGLDAAPTATSYQFFRPGRALRDPDTKELLGYETTYLGVGVNIRAGDPSTFRLTESREEIGVGDRLVASPELGHMSYVPRVAEMPLEGRVLSVYGGVDQAATNMIISINRGASQGVETGHVLRLLRYGPTIKDKTSAEGDAVKLPDEPIAQLFVFRVFPTVSYGLVLNATNAVQVGDRVSSELER